MIIKELHIKPSIGKRPKSLTMLVDYEGEDVVVMVSPPPPVEKVGIFLRLLALEAARHKKVKDQKL